MKLTGLVANQPAWSETEIHNMETIEVESPNYKSEISPVFPRFLGKPQVKRVVEIQEK